MILNADKLSKIYIHARGDKINTYIGPINDTLIKYSIKHIAMFIAQIGVESMELQSMEENLNYSAQRLLQVFPSHFRGVDVNDYARDPEAIGNRIYANRMGNGSEDSGDGYKFRGRGAMQLTGRQNYELYSKYLNKDIDSTISFMTTPEGQIDSAGWFWATRNVEACGNDLVAATKKINGGLNGIDARKALFYKAYHLIDFPS